MKSSDIKGEGEDVENIFCRNFMMINLRRSKVFKLEGERERERYHLAIVP